MSAITPAPEVKPSTGGSFFGHPKMLANLFTVEMWERFSFYGMQVLIYVDARDREPRIRGCGHHRHEIAVLGERDVPVLLVGLVPVGTKITSSRLKTLSTSEAQRDGP